MNRQRRPYKSLTFSNNPIQQSNITLQKNTFDSIVATNGSIGSLITKKIITKDATIDNVSIRGDVESGTSYIQGNDNDLVIKTNPLVNSVRLLSSGDIIVDSNVNFRGNTNMID